MQFDEILEIKLIKAIKYFNEANDYDLKMDRCINNYCLINNKTGIKISEYTNAMTTISILIGWNDVLKGISNNNKRKMIEDVIMEYSKAKAYKPYDYGKYWERHV